MKALKLLAIPALLLGVSMCSAGQKKSSDTYHAGAVFFHAKHIESPRVDAPSRDLHTDRSRDRDVAYPAKMFILFRW